MQPQDQFGPIRDYQDTLGVSQEDLDALLCAPCSGLRVGDFEDEMTERFLRYLRYITCIPWYREYEINGRPDGQYGTIMLLYEDDVTSVPSTRWNIVTNEAGEELKDACESVTNWVSFTWRLRVLRDQGAKADRENDAPEQPGATHPPRSARDVMRWVKQRTRHDLFKRALASAGMGVHPNFMGRITNLRADVNVNWECQSTAEFTFFSCVSSKLRIPAISSAEDIEIDLNCVPDNPPPCILEFIKC